MTTLKSKLHLSAALVSVSLIALGGNPPSHLLFQREQVTDHLRGNGDMVLDSNGRPHIAFEATEAESPLAELKYARWDGTRWTLETLTKLGVGGAGYIALDSHNMPHISYAKCNPYSCSAGFADSVGGQWQLVDLAEGRGRIVIDSADNIHTAYMHGNMAGGISLRYATRVNGTWITSTLYSELDRTIVPALALNHQNEPRIAYFAYGALRYASRTGEVWTTQMIEDQLGVGDDYIVVDMALDAADQPHLAYYNLVQAELHYATRVGQRWITTTVDHVNGRMGGVSIALDALAHPHLAYVDTTRNVLKYARWSGTGWERLEIDSGDPIALRLDAQGLPRIAYRYWDGIAGHAFVLKMAWSKAARVHYFPAI